MSGKETTTMEVIVHKKAVSLMANETIGLFTQRLGDASREHIKGKLNIAKGSGGAWLMEAFGDKVVVAAYKGDDPTKYYASTYSRDSLGKFDFGSATEVERVTTFKPKSDMSVSKAKKKEEMEEDEEEKACGGKTKKALGEPLEFGGWRETQKSFWMGVL